MRYSLLILLGLSLPVLAAEGGQQQQGVQGNRNPSSFIDAIIDVEPPCDPYKAMPPFN